MAPTDNDQGWSALLAGCCWRGTGRLATGRTPRRSASGSTALAGRWRRIRPSRASSNR